jgi:pyruvate-formate lyase-activating enzyme
VEITQVIIDSFQEFEDCHSLVLFSKGCNLACPECYNLEQANNSKRELGNVYDVIDRYLNPMHEAVVFLGGEPFIWKDDLVRVSRYVKEKGLKTKIFTNGLGSHNTLLQLCDDDLVDMFSVDIKCVRDCATVTGKLFADDDAYLTHWRKTVTIAIRYGIPVELRTTEWDCVKDQLDDIKKHVHECFPGLPHIIQDKFKVDKRDVI